MEGLKLPLYAKLSLILLLLCLVTAVILAGRHIIMPLMLALLFAIQLRPVVVFFNTRLKVPYVIAVTIAVLALIFLVAGVIFFISSQATEFSDDLPRIRKNLETHLGNLQQWIQETFNISYEKQQNLLKSAATPDTISGGKKIVSNTLQSFSGFALNLMLIPVYIFLFLLYHDSFRKFMAELVASENYQTLKNIVHEVKIVIQRYITGLLIEMGIVATMTSAGYTLIGLPHAVLLGVIAGVLNLIPYVGILFAGILALITSLAESTDLSMVLGVVSINVIIQLIDNNLLVPWVVGSKVRINALASIVGVFIGAELGGVTGMFLAIPMMAIMKVIFERIPALKPWRLLLGEDAAIKKKKWKIFKRRT